MACPELASLQYWTTRDWLVDLCLFVTLVQVSPQPNLGNSCCLKVVCVWLYSARMWSIVQAPVIFSHVHDLPPVLPAVWHRAR